MGGERASTSRMRLTGKICCVCRVSLKPDPTHPTGERYCDRCAPRRRVYMSFFSRSGWYCQFLEEDLKTPLPRTFTFATSDKILQLAEHAGALRNLECRQAIEHGGGNGVTPKPLPDDSVTFAWFVKQRYIPMREGDWSPAYKKSNTYELEHYLTSHFGNLPLRNLDAFEIQIQPTSAMTA